MPIGKKCRHPNCDGGPCKALTPEELTPTEEDRALAERLVSEGWIQVSAKYRHLRRWKTPPPTLDEMIRPEHQNSYFAKRIKERFAFMYDDLELRCAPDDLVEERTLSPREFKAFKDLKNKPWRDMIKRHREEAKAAGREPNL